MEVRSEEGRVVRGKGAEDAGGHQVWERMLLERAYGADAEVGDRADVEDGSPVGELAHQAGVVHGADTVTDPVRPEPLEGIADRVDTGELSGMGYRGEAVFARETKDVLERCRWVLDFRPSEAHPDDSPVSVGGRVSDHELGLVDP